MFFADHLLAEKKCTCKDACTLESKMVVIGTNMRVRAWRGFSTLGGYGHRLLMKLGKPRSQTPGGRSQSHLITRHRLFAHAYLTLPDGNVQAASQS